MALQTVKKGLWLPRVPDVSGGALALDEASLTTGLRLAMVVRVPRTGNISKVGFRVGTVTDSQTLRAGLETVGATDGLPTGTQYGGSAVGTQAAPSANTNYTVTLGTPASATAGDPVAVVIQYDSAAGTLGIARQLCGWNNAAPYLASYNSGWFKLGTARLYPFWLEYDDGGYEPLFAYPFTAYNSHTFNSGSTPDERALRFQLPFPTRVAGLWWLGTAGSNGNFDVVVYQGTTSQGSVSVDGDQVDFSGGGSLAVLPFATGIDVVKDTEYFLSFKPTSATDINVRSVDVASAAAMDGLDGGTAIYYAERTNAGAWTTTTTRRLLAGLILDQFDDGTGGGGGGALLRPVSQSGGLV